MKKIFNFLSISLILCLGFVSCDEEETTFKALSYPTDAFISFTSTTSSILENSSTPVLIKVEYSNVSSATEDVSIDFTVSSNNATAGVDYTVVNNKSSFSFSPSNGVYSDVVEIQPINNFIAGTEDLLINITLGASTYGTGFPGPDSLGKVISLTILDDDCPFSLQGLGDATWSGSDDVPSTQAGPNNTEVETSYDGTNLLMEGLSYAWIIDTSYWDEVVVTSNKVIVNVDLVTGVINIPLQYLCTTTWNGAVQADYSIEASGTYTSCSKTMVLNYKLYQGGSVLRSFKETITKN